MISTLVFFMRDVLISLFDRKFTNILHVSGIAKTMYLTITFLLLVDPFYIIHKFEQQTPSSFNKEFLFNRASLLSCTSFGVMSKGWKRRILSLSRL